MLGSVRRLRVLVLQDEVLELLVARKALYVPLQRERPFLAPVDCEESEATVAVLSRYGLPGS